MRRVIRHDDTRGGVAGDTGFTYEMIPFED